MLTNKKSLKDRKFFYDTDDVPHPFSYRFNDDNLLHFKFKYRDGLSTLSRAEYLTLTFQLLNNGATQGVSGKDLILDVRSKIASTISSVQKESVVWEYATLDCFLYEPDVSCRLSIPLNSVRGKVRCSRDSVDRKPLKLRMYASDGSRYPKLFQISVFGCSKYATPLGSQSSDDEIINLVNLFSSDIEMPLTGLKMRYVKCSSDERSYPISVVITL